MIQKVILDKAKFNKARTETNVIKFRDHETILESRLSNAELAKKVMIDQHTLENTLSQINLGREISRERAVYIAYGLDVTLDDIILNEQPK